MAAAKPKSNSKISPANSSVMAKAKGKGRVAVTPDVQNSASKIKKTKQMARTTKPFLDTVNFPFDDIDLGFPSPSSSPVKSLKKTTSNSTVLLSSTQAPISSPPKKRRGRPPKAKTTEVGNITLATNVSDLEEEIPLPKAKRARIANTHNKSLTSAQMTDSDNMNSAGPSRSISCPGSRDYTEDIEEHDLSEFLTLCDTSSPAISQPVFTPSCIPDDLIKDDSIYVKDQKCWWAARLLRFIPADNLKDQQKGKDLYEVETIFGAILKKKRDQIITKTDQAIADCTLGGFTVKNRIFTSDALKRDPTPEPSSPIEPLLPAEYTQLRRVDQIYAIRPHLLDILNDQYEPAIWRANKFFAGGKKRLSLNSEAAYGDIHEDEVTNVILPELHRWVLRAEGRNDGQTRSDEPTRPSGTKRYNSLTIHEIKQYIDFVLLPETIIQICIRSVELSDLIESAQSENGDEDDKLLLNGLSRGEEENDNSTKAFRTFEKEKKKNFGESEQILNEIKIYKLARNYILNLREKNLDKDFEIRCSELLLSRRKMRLKFNLPEENLNLEELNKWKLNNKKNEYNQIWLTGRIIEKKKKIKIQGEVIWIKT
ncbi:uncharacterized protein I206_107064 [Kwoniella pini CBS 10737]|uniref:Uncharacterized protein n=1 Tax=Kwoniella pini CBS 10737 TaxID=1296096 RepID=A0A1B9HZB1_9TREE|nr:uncharacterized protein I206_05392 [Kwoniella pini CBS 10737]OCF48612.1 hypothetical protein I206_05392 [Kwoniella pini CBS 10737]